MNLQHPYHVMLSVTPTVSAAAYADGDNIGGKMTFAGASRQTSPDSSERSYGGVIRSVIITELAAHVANIEVVFFDDDPDGTTFSDNDALDIADADLPKICGVVVVSTWQAFADNNVGYATGLDIPYQLATGTSLYATMLAAGAEDLDSTSDITVRLGLELD